MTKPRGKSIFHLMTENKAMDDYEFLILFYCLEEDGSPEAFGPLGELTCCTYRKYNKASGDNCLGHVHPESPLQPLIAAINGVPLDAALGEKDKPINEIALDLLLSDRDLLQDYLIRLHGVARLEA